MTYCWFSLGFFFRSHTAAVSAGGCSAYNGDLLGLTMAMDSYILAVKDGTSNTLMIAERPPMTAADAWTLEVLARAWVTPLR